MITQTLTALVLPSASLFHSSGPRHMCSSSSFYLHKNRAACIDTASLVSWLNTASPQPYRDNTSISRTSQTPPQSKQPAQTKTMADCEISPDFDGHSPATYQYSDIRPTEQVRLFTILEDGIDSTSDSKPRLRIQIDVYERGHEPAYEALSYTWGDPDERNDHLQ